MLWGQGCQRAGGTKVQPQSGKASISRAGASGVVVERVENTARSERGAARRHEMPLTIDRETFPESACKVSSSRLC